MMIRYHMSTISNATTAVMIWNTASYVRRPRLGVMEDLVVMISRCVGALVKRSFQGDSSASAFDVLVAT
jgi:hypothetical protein